MDRLIKQIIKYPINDLVDNDTYKKIYRFLHKQGIRDHAIKRIYKILRKKYNSPEAIAKIQSLFPNLSIETIRRLSYGETVHRYRKMV